MKTNASPPLAAAASLLGTPAKMFTIMELSNLIVLLFIYISFFILFSKSFNAGNFYPEKNFKWGTPENKIDGQIISCVKLNINVIKISIK